MEDQYDLDESEAIGPADYMIRVRAIREGRNMTQMQVASELDTSQTMYSRYERGATQLPVRHLIALCRLFGVSADYLLGISEEGDDDEEEEYEDEYEDDDEEEETLVARSLGPSDAEDDQDVAPMHVTIPGVENEDDEELDVLDPNDLPE